MQRVSDQSAWILHKRPFKEADLILDVLSEDFGRVSLIARGGRKSRKAANLQPFQALTLSWSKRGELGNLLQHESQSLPIALTGEALWAGFYMNELLIQFIPQGEPVDERFLNLYQSCLRALPQAMSSALRRFEYAVLATSGLAFDLSTDAQGQAVLADTNYAWVAGLGLCPNQAGVLGRLLQKLDSAEPQDADLAETRPVVLAALKEQLSAPLKTAQMLQQLRALNP